MTSHDNKYTIFVWFGPDHVNPYHYVQLDDLIKSSRVKDYFKQGSGTINYGVEAVLEWH
jgi:hypothetical protein